MILDTLNHGHLVPRVSGDFYYLTRARLIANTHSRHSDNVDGLSTAPSYLNSQFHSCSPDTHLHLQDIRHWQKKNQKKNPDVVRNSPSVVKTLCHDGDMSAREIRSLTFKVTLLVPGEDFGARAAITLEKKSDIMNNNPSVGIINLCQMAPR